MSLRAHLQMVDLTATFRGDEHDRPVHVGYDGTRVIVVANPKHAELLAKMIARVTGDLRDVDDVDPQLWDHIVVDVMASVAMAGPLPAPTDMPTLEVVR